MSVPAETTADPAEPQPTTSIEFCVWYGGEDANDCAGTRVFDDLADADEALIWTIPDHGRGIAQRIVTRTPWQHLPDPDPDLTDDDRQPAGG